MESQQSTQSQQNYLMSFLLFLWTSAWIPSISYAKIFTGQVRMMSPSQLQWRYWAIVGTMAFMTYNQFFVGFLQRMMNSYRETCYCDFVRIMSRTTPVEAFFLGWGSPELTRSYLFCRETCP